MTSWSCKAALPKTFAGRCGRAIGVVEIPIYADVPGLPDVLLVHGAWL